MYRRIVEEVCAVARAEGVDLPEATTEEWMRFAQDLDSDAYSSLHYDLTHEKPLELEALNAAVVDHAEAVDVEVPMNEAVTAVLAPWAERFDDG
ncbi:ketopantoate reductase family protein [Halomicroarcula sp. GCM10025710]